MEDLHSERDVMLHHLTVGLEFITFFLFAGPGTGTGHLVLFTNGTR